MDTQFRILFENTFNFKGGKLYLMLLRENTNFGVEVVDREKSFGRKYTKDRKEADVLFDAITKRLSTCKNLSSAENAIKKSFSRKKLAETLFLLGAEGRTFSQDDIGDMVVKFKLKVRAKYDSLCGEKKKGAITIYVSFNIKGKSLGRFYGTRFGKDFLFETLSKK